MPAYAQEYCPTLADTLRSLEVAQRINLENPNARLVLIIMAGNPNLSQEGDRMLRIEGETEGLQYYHRKINTALAQVSQLDRIFQASDDRHTMPKGISSRPVTQKLQTQEHRRPIYEQNEIWRTGTLYQSAPEVFDLNVNPSRILDLLAQLADEIDESERRLNKEGDQP